MNKPETWTDHWGFARDFGLTEHDRIATEQYTSPDVYQKEKDRLFRKTWLAVARVSEIPEPGDFLKREILTLDTEVVLVRDKKDGVIRAFYNACPHRGVALVRQCSGRTGLFVCPYHGWSFRTDGKLQGMPGSDNFPQVDRKETGLAPIHCDVWNDYIFLNFDEEPEQSLKQYLGELGALYSDLPFSDYGHAVDIVQDSPTNWKNFLDAFNEGYHVAVLHAKSLPALATGENPLNHMYDQALMAPHSRATIQSNADYRPSGKVEQLVIRALARGALNSGGADGTTPARPFGTAEGVNRIGLPSTSSELINIFPLSQFHATQLGYMWFQFWPLGPDKVRFATRVYFARKPRSYREQFVETFMCTKHRDVVSEDVAMTHIQHIGMKSGGLKYINIGEMEPLVRFTHAQIQKYLNDDASSARRRC